MKANVPKKLYLIQRNGLISYFRNNEDDAEYILTDAFIKKAVEWLSEIENGTTITDIDKFVEDFKKAMKL